MIGPLRLFFLMQPLISTLRNAEFCLLPKVDQLTSPPGFYPLTGSRSSTTTDCRIWPSNRCLELQETLDYVTKKRINTLSHLLCKTWVPSTVYIAQNPLTRLAWVNHFRLIQAATATLTEAMGLTVDCLTDRGTVSW